MTDSDPAEHRRAANGIVEVSNRVFEWTITPDYDEQPDRCNRELVIRLLSGPPLKQLEMSQVQQNIVRLLIETGNHVHRVILGDQS